MRFLLDTHILLWWLDDSKALPAEARRLIADPENAIFVSAASIWEISIKQSLGKLDLPNRFDEVLAQSDFEPLPVRAEHARATRELPLIHRDPFDRMLVAQARVEGLTLLTADPAVARYGALVRLC
ncbi:MAG: type II toxin-antitoxin system VapC family toxin [Bryobacteraceae bacterium]